MSAPDRDPIDTLFDIALALNAEACQSFQQMVLDAAPEMSEALKNRLELYQPFDDIMEEEEALPHMLEDHGLGEKQTLLETQAKPVDPDPDLEPGTEPAMDALSGFFEDEDRDEAGIPKRIGEYRILKVVGEGGQGTVYQAWQKQPKRKVALKLIHKVAYFWNREFHTRFSREYQALAMMNHHHIAGI